MIALLVWVQGAAVQITSQQAAAFALTVLGGVLTWLCRSSLTNGTKLTEVLVILRGSGERPGLVADVETLKETVPRIRGEAIDAAGSKVQEVLSSLDQRIQDGATRMDQHLQPWRAGDPERRQRP